MYCRMETETAPRPVHEGRNVKRIREMIGIKQEALAMDLGLSQQAVSQLEQRETIDRDMLEKVAKALKVTPEAIKNFSEEAAIYYFNTFQDSSINHGHFSPNFKDCTFNPLERLMEVVEENKKLYERMLKEKDAMIEELKKYRK